MAITDHIAILTHAALAEPARNKKKSDKRGVAFMEFYALFAFPPAAGNDLAEIAKRVAPGGSLAGLSINVKTNSQQAKPIPGIPGDWFIIRSSSQYAPFIADMHGHQLVQGADSRTIRAKFYAGKKVRAALSCYFWPSDGGGISFNLDGVMEAGDGERLAIGNSAPAAFEKYADKSAPTSTSQPAQNNPFGGSTTPAASSGSTAGGDNPFAQTGAGTGTAANPFVTA